MPCTFLANPHGTLLFLLLLLLAPPIKAQQPPPPPPLPLASNQNYNSPMATALIVMIIVFFSVGFISVYLRHFLACLGIRPHGGPLRRGGTRRWTREPPCGLDPTIVNAFPTFLYSDVKIHRVGKTTPLECAICLNEFADHEILQLLPKCSHVFHPHCIGPWLATHVTCPVCRANLEIQVCDERSFESLHNQQNSEDELEPSDQDDHHRDVIVRVETPIQEIMKGLSESGRMVNLPRSHSTGHSLVEDCERFTLRLPDEVRNKLVNVNYLSGLPAAIVSPRVGYRARSVGCGATTQGKPDGWRFSMSPPFITRPGSSNLEVSYSNGKNNDFSISRGILKSPKNILKIMKSPNKSPLNRVVSCNDIGERSSDRLWAHNPACQEQELEGH